MCKIDVLASKKNQFPFLSSYLYKINKKHEIFLNFKDLIVKKIARNKNT